MCEFMLQACLTYVPYTDSHEIFLHAIVLVRHILGYMRVMISLTMKPMNQWLGPSWHPAFYTVRAAQAACENSVAVCKLDKGKKLKWWLELNALYGKEFLDDLQESVQACHRTSRPLRAKKKCLPAKPRRKACEKGQQRVSEQVAGTVVRVAKRVSRGSRAFATLWASSPQ